MSIASRIETIEEHLEDDYSVLEVAGADLTNVDKNIINLKPTWKERLLYFMNNGTDEVWNNWDKVVGEGESLSLNNTLEAKMKIELKGNTYQYSTSGKNKANIYNIADFSGSSFKRTVENDTITIWDNVNTSGYSTTEKKLSQICPNLQVGDSAKLTFTTTYATKYIYLIGKNITWSSGSTKTIDQDMLDSIVVLYGGYQTTTVISEFMIRLSSITDETYEPFTNGASPNPSYPQDIQVVSGDNTIKVEGKNLFNPNTSMVKQVRSFASSNILDATTNTSISINSQNYLTGTSNDYIVVATPFDYIKGKTIYNVGHKGSRKMIVYDNTGAVLEVFYPTGSPYTPSFNFSGYLGVGIDINKNVDNEYIQISYDINATYQAYQGSQSYPINLGVENLFNPTFMVATQYNLDGTTSSTNYYSLSNNIINISSAINSVGRKFMNKITLPKGDYVLSFNQNKESSTTGLRTTIRDMVNATDITMVDKYNLSSRIEIPFTLSSSTTIAISIQFVSADDGELNLREIQLEKGNNASSYTPYGEYIELCKIGTYQDKIAKSTGKNLFDIGTNSTDDYYNNYISSINKNSITMNGAGGASSRFVRYQNYKGNDTYTISLNNSKTSANNRGLIRVRKLDDSGWITSDLGISGLTYNSTYGGWFFAMSTNGNKATQTITIPECLYWQFGYINIYNESVTIYNIQIEKGSTATSYEPYGTSWYLYKEIGKNTISSNMQLYGNYGVDNKPLYYWDSLELHLPNIGVCNKFVLYETTTAEGISYMPNNNFRTQGYTTVRYYFRYDDIESLQAFNTEISTNPLEIYYIKSTPTYTEITDTTLLSQLNALGNANSYNNQTNISQTNNILSFEIDAIALKNI